MDSRNSTLILGLYLCGAIVVSSAGLAYYSYLRPASATTRSEDRSATGMLQPSRDLTGFYSATLARANQSIRELQGSLTGTRDALEKRSAALNQKTAECKALRTQLDQSIVLMLSLLDEESDPALSTSDARKQTRAKLDEELALLRNSEGRTESTSDPQQQEVVGLQAQLLQADMELTALRENAERELALLRSEKQSVEETAIGLIADFGEPAVPLLIALLPNERVEIRRWAAKALGTLGPAASDAQMVLRELLSDPDQAVRTEASQALARIE